MSQKTTASEDILQQIRFWMSNQCITMREVAQKLQIPESTLSSRFKQKNISIDLLVQMADAVGLELRFTLLSKH